MRGTTDGRGLAPLLEARLGQGSARGAHRAAGRRHEDIRPAHVKRVGRALDGVGGLGWGVLGFLVGAVFWHFVGFWAFVSDVVLAGGPEAAREDQVSNSRSGWVQTADASAAMSACVSLSLDRRTGVTSAQACDAGGEALASDALQGREDRIGGDASASEWVAPHAPAGALGGRGP
jgi:hypothetical protein